LKIVNAVELKKASIVLTLDEEEKRFNQGGENILGRSETKS